jgi:hypothetical protein
MVVLLLLGCLKGPERENQTRTTTTTRRKTERKPAAAGKKHGPARGAHFLSQRGGRVKLEKKNIFSSWCVVVVMVE